MSNLANNDPEVALLPAETRTQRNSESNFFVRTQFACVFAFLLLITVMAYFSVAPNPVFVVIVAAAFSGLLVLMFKSLGIDIEGTVKVKGRKFRGPSAFVVWLILTLIMYTSFYNTIQSSLAILGAYLNGRTELRSELKAQLDTTTDRVEKLSEYMESQLLAQQLEHVDPELRDQLKSDLTDMKAIVADIQGQFSANSFPLTEDEQSQIVYTKALIALATKNDEEFEQIVDASPTNASQFSARIEFLNCTHSVNQIVKDGSSTGIFDFEKCDAILNRLSIGYPNDRSILFVQAYMKFRKADFNSAAQLYRKCRIEGVHRLFASRRSKFDEIFLLAEAACYSRSANVTSANLLKKNIIVELENRKNRIEAYLTLHDLDTYLLTWKIYQNIYMVPVPQSEMQWMKQQALRTKDKDLIREISYIWANKISVNAEVRPDPNQFIKSAKVAMDDLSHVDLQVAKDLKLATYFWETLANNSLRLYHIGIKQSVEPDVQRQLLEITVNSHDKSKELAGKLKSEFKISEPQYEHARIGRVSLIPPRPQVGVLPQN